jgi:photosystem II stability/assembly factor-like uncharacterized protein
MRAALRNARRARITPLSRCPLFSSFILVLTLVTPLFAQGSLEWSNPLPGGATYYSVQLIDGQTGWICGQNGNLLKTSDGGMTWRAQQSGTSADLRSVCFVDAQNGFSGGGSHVLKTGDGGMTWQPLPLVPDSDVNTLFFINDSHGWLATGYNYIYRTEDGGLNWTSAYQGSPYAIFSIHFIDEMTGFWLGFGGINKSTDGGKTFRMIFDAPFAWSYNRISFVSAATAYILGDGGVIAKTNDAGERWNQIYKFSNVNVSDIYFHDEQRGCAVGSGIWTTADGGQSWQKVLETYGLRDVHFSGATGCAVGSQGQIWISQDYGISWHAAHSDFVGFNDLTGIAFNDPDFGLLIGNNGSLFRTLDGGASWTRLNLALDYWLKDLHIFDAHSACIISDSRIYRFTFTGSEWTPAFSETVAGSRINRLFFLDRSLGWTAGYDIMYTRDGGVTWKTQLRYSGDEHLGICFISDRKGFAVGTYSGLYATTDGGTSWQKRSLPVDKPLQSIHFIAPETGFCTGEGVILKSSNGGESWRVVHQDDRLNLLDITSLDTQHLVAIGGNMTGNNTELSTLLYSGDGGESWQRVAQPAVAHLRNALFLDRNHGWICGGQATLLNYHDTLPLPAPPRDLQAQTSDGAVRLQWLDESDNEEGFEILRSDESGAFRVIDSTAVNSTEFSDRMVQPGTLYGYRLRAFNAQGRSFWTREAGIMTSLAPLAAPLLLYPADNTITHVPTPAFSWTAVGQATSYHLQLARDTLFSDIVREETAWPNTYLTAGPLAYGTYYWRVQGVAAGRMGEWSAVWRFTVQESAPQAPLLEIPANHAQRVQIPARLDWQDLPGARRYRLQLALSITFWQTLVDTMLIQSACTIASLETQHTYYWRVSALNDGGAGPWSTIFSFTTTAPVNEWIEQNSGTDDFIGSVYFQDARLGWAVGNAGLMLHSQDGGRSWRPQVNPANDRLESVFFTSPHNGWAVGGIRATVLHTVDGGRNWQKVPFVNSDAQMMESVFFADSLRGWIAGSGGLYGTEDGGATWQLLSAKGMAIYALHALTHATLFASCSDGIASSRDGGRSWTILQPGTYCYGFQALDELSLWYATNNGFWHSLDGGVTWQENAQPYRFTDVAFFDYTTGFLSAEEKLLKTTDSGFSWVEQTTDLPGQAQPGTWKLAVYSSPDSLYGWAAGTFGTILHFTAPRGTCPIAPKPVAPPPLAIGVPIDPILTWTGTADASGYRVQLSLDPNFSSTLIDSVVTVPSLQTPPLGYAHEYYWRIQAHYGSRLSLWSFPRRFITVKKTAVETEDSMHMTYTLDQNYPNPFNASTVIPYCLMNQGEVDITLYDLQGREVMRLEKGMKEEGVHHLVLDARHLPAGIYLIRLLSRDGLLVRKIALIR